MKRSNSIKLVLIGASLISLTACDQTNKHAETIFRSEEECRVLSHADSSVCAEAMKTAKEEHAKTAPHYISMIECEEKFGVGNCVNQPEKSQTSHHSVFMPMMMGFMMGNMMNARSAQPIYRDKSSNLFSKGAQFARSDHQSSRSGGFGGAARFRSASS